MFSISKSDAGDELVQILGKVEETTRKFLEIFTLKYYKSAVQTKLKKCLMNKVQTTCNSNEKQSIFESKEHSKSELEDDIKYEINNDIKGLKLPLIDIKVSGYKKNQIDGAGKPYNAYKILYYKISLDDNDPSRFGIKTVRYRRLYEFQESLQKDLKESDNKDDDNGEALKILKTFPPKSYAFWKNNNDEFLKEREKDLTSFWCDCCLNKTLYTNDFLQKFLGLKYDEKRLSEMKIFRNALISTCGCETINYRIPTDFELNQFDTEQDMLVYCIMEANKINMKNKIDAMLSKIDNEKLKQVTRKQVNKSLAVCIQKPVETSWNVIKKMKDLIFKELENIIENKMDNLNKSLDFIIEKIMPLISKKTNPKTQIEKDEDTDIKNDFYDCDEKSEINIKYLNKFINKLNDNNYNSFEKLLQDYSSTIIILTKKENQCKISKFLCEIFMFEYGKYIKYVLKSFKKYEKGSKLICDSTAQLIQFSFSLTIECMNELFICFDNKQNDNEIMLSLLKNIGTNIAHKIGEESDKICKILQSVNGNATGIILELPAILGGMIGNLMTNLINDCCKNINYKQSMEKHLKNYFKIFCECILEKLYESILYLLLNEIKIEIKNDIDKLLGNKLKFDFIPKIIPESIPKDIVETFVVLVVQFMLKRNMKKKKKKLKNAFYKVVSSSK